MPVTSAAIAENEIHHFSLNLKETELSRRLSKLPSITKHGAKFRHVICCSFVPIYLEVLCGQLFPSSYFCSFYFTVGLKLHYQQLTALMTYCWTLPYFCSRFASLFLVIIKLTVLHFACMDSLSSLFIFTGFLFAISYDLFCRCAFWRFQ